MCIHSSDTVRYNCVCCVHLYHPLCCNNFALALCQCHVISIYICVLQKESYWCYYTIPLQKNFCQSQPLLH